MLFELFFCVHSLYSFFKRKKTLSIIRIIFSRDVMMYDLYLQCTFVLTQSWFMCILYGWLLLLKRCCMCVCVWLCFSAEYRRHKHVKDAGLAGREWTGEPEMLEWRILIFSSVKLSRWSIESCQGRDLWEPISAALSFFLSTSIFSPKIKLPNSQVMYFHLAPVWKFERERALLKVCVCLYLITVKGRWVYCI